MSAVCKNKDGYITNAGELTAADVAMQKVLCPACNHPFNKWPLGWDAHASANCSFQSVTPKDRKRKFKQTYLRLFRNKDMSKYNS